MKMDTIDIAGNRQAEYVVDSNDALHLKLVRLRTDLDDDSTTFHPEMSHQVYGDNESIYGYSGLAIQLYYSAGRLTTYAGFTYKARVSSQQRGVGDTQPDQVIQPLAEKLQRPFCNNLDTFASAIESAEERQFRPPGKLVHSFCGRRLADSKADHSGNESGVDRCNFEIYQCDTETPGLRDFHERLQTFLLWFVDAASFIDTDDDRWRFWLCFERYCGQDGEARYAIAGYVTVYEYYAYPSHLRPRISQMLVLPPFQKQGIGSELLQSVYNSYKKREDVVDITVEDPSEDFVRIRDFVDCLNCRDLEAFSREKLLQGFSKEMTEKAKAQLKINGVQARRIYEILRLGAINVHNKEEYSAYRLDVKRRLFAPYHKEDVQLKKLSRVMRPEELALSITSKEQRQESLDRIFKELEEKYSHTLKCLSLNH